MNKKDIIDKLNNVNINKNYIILNRLQLRPISKRVIRNLRENIDEMFPAVISDKEVPLAAFSSNTQPQNEKIKPLLNRQEIHKMLRKEFQNKNQKIDTKILKETPRLNVSSLNQKPDFHLKKSENREKSLFKTETHFFSSPINLMAQSAEKIIKIPAHKSATFSFGSKKQEPEKARPEAVILRHLNQKKTTQTKRVFSPSEERQNSTPLFTPSPRAQQSSPSKKMGENSAPVLFPKPERDLLLAILKDIQNKVSAKKNYPTRISIPTPQNGAQIAGNAINALNTALRQSLR